jgi:hypothetical protein
VDVYGTRVEPTDAVVFWTHHDRRRFIYPLDWPSAKELVERILARFHNGAAHWVNLQSSLARLATTGQPTKVVLEDHVIGLVRPWVAGSLPQAVEAPEPVMLSKAGTPPILFANVEDGREFARRARDDYDVSPSEWAAFLGEVQPHDAAKMWRPWAALW